VVVPTFLDAASGKILDAGGLVFASGDGWSYGRWDYAYPGHALAPYESVRETDYGTAACVMVHRSLFVALDLCV